MREPGLPEHWGDELSRPMDARSYTVILPGSTDGGTQEVEITSRGELPTSEILAQMEKQMAVIGDGVFRSQYIIAVLPTKPRP